MKTLIATILSAFALTSFAAEPAKKAEKKAEAKPAATATATAPAKPASAVPAPAAKKEEAKK
jgi:hypothetical protein